MAVRQPRADRIRKQRIRIRYAACRSRKHPTSIGGHDTQQDARPANCGDGVDAAGELVASGGLDVVGRQKLAAGLVLVLREETGLRAPTRLGPHLLCLRPRKAPRSQRPPGRLSPTERASSLGSSPGVLAAPPRGARCLADQGRRRSRTGQDRASPGTIQEDGPTPTIRSQDNFGGVRRNPLELARANLRTLPKLSWLRISPTRRASPTRFRGVRRRRSHHRGVSVRRDRRSRRSMRPRSRG